MEIITNACLVCTLVYQWIHNPQIQSNSCKLEKGKVNLIINGPNGLGCYKSLTQPLPDLLKQIFPLHTCATNLLVHVILIHRCNSKVKNNQHQHLPDVWTFSSEGCIGDIGKSSHLAFFFLHITCTVLIIQRCLFTCMHVCGMW